ncbi:MAG: tRNA (adenosine(37)-N6)-threonylcarbamoyltransferase complex dimerization subunit type 1 TsaB [Gammaproteobacteria bacterium]
MKILAFDTSSAACSVALLNEEKITSRHELIPMQQAKQLLPMIDALLAADKIKPNQLDAIAFGCGPGSFTGVRIAVSVAAGLAYATQKPLISISSLAAVAQAAYDDLGWKQLLVACDARINEVYWAAYEVQTDNLVHLNGIEQVTLPEAIIHPGTDGWSGVGNAWDVYADKISFKPDKVDITRLPMATALITLAKAKFSKQEWVNAAEAVPVYLRDDVAKKSHQK